MSRNLRPWAGGVCRLIGFTVALLLVSVKFGDQAASARDVMYDPRVVIPLNKSVTLTVPTSFTSAVVGSADIADVLPMTDRTLLIEAKKIGTTNVSIYDVNMHLVEVVDVEVAIDTATVQATIRAAIGDRGIRVSSSNGQIILGGIARDAANADRAVNLAKAWSPKGVDVINAMRIAAPQQVLLKVRFLEVDRNAGRQIGVNWIISNGSGTRGVTTGLGGLTTQTPQACGAGGICPPIGNGIFQTAGTLTGTNPGAPFGTILAEVVNNGVKIDALITALETKGLVQQLAEPDLVALSGETASFQAGGQIPVPIAVTSGIGVATPTIEYKDFGILLRFRPTVLENGIINVSINPEVSQLDFTNAVTFQGTTIPALTRRTATTTIELRDGQSFAIAGLLAANGTRNVSQLPWVGSLPVLGALFRSPAFQKNESDLVIIVTPHLVQPAPPGARLATPFDNQVPSNDVDFFLLGQMEKNKQYSDYVTHGGDVQGPYGAMVGEFHGAGGNGLDK